MEFMSAESGGNSHQTANQNKKRIQRQRKIKNKPSFPVPSPLPLAHTHSRSTTLDTTANATTSEQELFSVPQATLHYTTTFWSFQFIFLSKKLYLISLFLYENDRNQSICTIDPQQQWCFQNENYAHRFHSS